MRRRPNSTNSGLVIAGRISPKAILTRETPSDSAALTKSCSLVSSVHPRATRAMRGACESPTVSTMSHRRGPTTETSSSTKMISGKARSASRTRMTRSSMAARAYPAKRPSAMPRTMPIAVAMNGQDEHGAAAVEHAAEHVASDAVAAQRRDARRLGVRRR